MQYAVEKSAYAVDVRLNSRKQPSFSMWFDHLLGIIGNDNTIKINTAHLVEFPHETPKTDAMCSVEFRKKYLLLTM